MSQNLIPAESLAVKSGQVILISGPGGSGKSATAASIAAEHGWVHISEDNFWAELKKGRPADEGRSSEEQALVQAQVLAKIREHTSQGQSVVLEFIVYENPPRPLLNYRAALTASGIEHETRVLCPSKASILERMAQRGRTNEQDPEAMSPLIDHQLSCLKAPEIAEAYRIDTSNIELEAVVERYFRPIVESFKKQQRS